MAPVATRLAGQRGAVLVHVAAALFAFTALTAVVIDIGLQFVGRNEIQTAVDAAAVAGATALAFDSYTDRTATGPATAAALAVARENLVRSAAPSVTADDVRFPVCTSTWGAPSGTPRIGCVRITAYRDAAHANAVPLLFASLLGLPSYDVAATATAEAINANTTDCLKPLAVPDRWTEQHPVDNDVWLPNSTFDLWDPANPAMLLPAPQDDYAAPNSTSGGSGMRMMGEVENEVWFGEQVTLRPGFTTTQVATISPWMYLPVQIPGSVWGANDVLENTTSCAGAAGKVSVGSWLGLAPGGVDPNAPLIADGLEELVGRDAGARWNAATERVENSCADVLGGACTPRRSMSPRIIAIALYDPLQFANDSHAGAPVQIRVRNIVGFFVESVNVECLNCVKGRIMRHPGQFNPAAVTLFDASSFLRASLLVN